MLELLNKTKYENIVNLKGVCKMNEFSHEYYEYCRKNNLMPTDEGYKIWLSEQMEQFRKNIMDKREKCFA